MMLARSQLVFVGKALEAVSSEIGLGDQVSGWPRALEVTGVTPGPGETMFFQRRQSPKGWRTYESAGGRVIRIVTPRYKELRDRAR